MIELRNMGARLKELIQAPEICFIMEAHNGLSARVAAEAGFEAIWASGLSMAASLGVRDCNEASWTQILEVVEFMTDAVRIPVLVDGDTGFGDFNIAARVVRKLEQRGVGGVCLEDKLFPKTNSFIDGTSQSLANADEFAGKLKACKDAQRTPGFVIVARIEAFIAGMGLEEALRRADKYANAGADAILIHSALSNPSEVLAFKEAWGDRLPVVIVPTKYYSTPTSVFRAHKFAAVVWANHLMRSALYSMQRTAKRIFEDQSLQNAEEHLVSVQEVFRIQGEPELALATRKYAPGSGRKVRALVLAASRGEELGELTADKPKCMVQIGGKAILAHIADTYRSAGLRDIGVVRGYQAQTVNLTSLTYFENPDYEKTQEVGSLARALDMLHGEVVISYGDVLFRRYVLLELLNATGDIIICVDSNWQNSRNNRRAADFVRCTAPAGRESFYGRSQLLELVERSASRSNAHGEYMGLLRLSEKGAGIVRSVLFELQKNNAEAFKSWKIPDLLSELLRKKHPIQVVYSAGAWLDIDSIDDVVYGSEFQL